MDQETKIQDKINEYLKTVLKTTEIDFTRDDVKTVINITIKDFKESIKNEYQKLLSGEMTPTDLLV